MGISRFVSGEGQRRTSLLQCSLPLAQIAALQGNTGTTASVSFSRDLTIGATGADVTSLQNWLISKGYSIPAGATGYFGTQTQAAVAAYQAANSIAPAAGYFGPITRAHVNAAAAPGTGTGTGTGSTGLQGGAGDLIVTTTSRGVEGDVGEGREENVLGLELEAQDSDIEVTNVRVEFTVDPATGASSRIDRYIDEVIVYLGDEEVGSVDADDLNRDGSKYTRSISLKGAVIEEGDEARFYVAVDAASTVADVASHVDVAITDIRFTDATGAIITLTQPSTDWTKTFGFDPAGGDDELTVDEARNNPVASTLKVETNDESDEHLVLIGEMEADDDSADITVYSGEVSVGNLAGGFAAADIEEMWVEIGNSTFDAELDGAVFVVDFGRNGFTIGSGDTEEFELYVIFKQQDGNYNATGATVSFTFTVTEAEGEDTLSSGQIKGSAKSETHSLSLSDVTVSADTRTPSRSEDGKIGTFSFDVTVESDDEIELDAADFLYSINGGAATGTPVLVFVDGDYDEATDELDGEATFRFEVTIDPGTGQGGNYSVRLDSVLGVKVNKLSSSLLLSE